MTVTNKSEESHGGAPAIRARRLGLFTQDDAIVLMRSDCHLCRAEGLAARSRVLLSSARRLLSDSFDSLVTIDPHPHHRRNLGEIFSIPACVEHAAPLLADWIARQCRATACAATAALLFPSSAVAQVPTRKVIDHDEE